VSIEKKERRLFKRFYFPKDAGITGLIQFPQTEGKRSPIIANIMNLSAGGAELYLKRTGGEKVDTKYNMTLKKIEGCKNLEFCTDIEFEIKRIVDIAPLDNILLGCYFLGVPKTIQDKLNDFVLAELEKKE